MYNTKKAYVTRTHAHKGDFRSQEYPERVLRCSEVDTSTILSHPDASRALFAIVGESQIKSLFSHSRKAFPNTK